VVEGGEVQRDAARRLKSRIKDVPTALEFDGGNGSFSVLASLGSISRPTTISQSFFMAKRRSLPPGASVRVSSG
jgi:hypothetical protein